MTGLSVLGALIPIVGDNYIYDDLDRTHRPIAVRQHFPQRGTWPMFVNGEFVNDELIRIEAASLRQKIREQMPGSADLKDDLEIAVRAHNWARENVIERVLLRMAAQQDATPIPAEKIQKALEQYYVQDSGQPKCLLRDEEALRSSVELDLRIERLTARITSKAARPKPREIKDYYDRNKQSFYRPELLHAAHIVKNIDETTSEAEALAAISAVQARLLSGSNFEQLADEFSDCPGRGGDLGLFPRGEMVEKFEAALFDLAPGETSDIFRSPFGFHIAKLYERRPAGLRSLDEVRGDIEKLLWEQKKMEAMGAFIAGLRARANIRKSDPATVR